MEKDFHALIFTPKVKLINSQVSIINGMIHQINVHHIIGLILSKHEAFLFIIISFPLRVNICSNSRFKCFEYTTCSSKSTINC
jgi:hypothetical protein